MNYLKLKSKLLDADIVALVDDEVRLVELNNPVEIKQAISVHDVQEYLILTDDLELIEASNSAACKRTVRALEIFTEFNVAHPVKGVAIEEKLVLILDGLVEDASLAFTESDKLAILALGKTNKSWAELNGYTPLRIGYFAKARAL